MNSQKLQNLLTRSEHLLAGNSWKNYQTFLGRVLRTLPHYSFLDPIEQALRSKDWNRLLEEAVVLSQQKHSDSTQHYVGQQVVALIKKYPFPKGTIKSDPRENAIAKFNAAEHRCKRINQRFRAFARRSPFESSLARAREYIAYVLGPFDINQAISQCDFGPGASVGVSGNATNSARKILSESWSVTPGALQYSSWALAQDEHIRQVLQTDMHYGHNDCGAAVDWSLGLLSRVEIVKYNKIAFVPKDAMVHRTMAIEPLLNGYLQTGVDRYLRKLLKRVGINLSDQSINQRLAYLASFDLPDGDVTIDLSSASDSISIELVRYLLPPDWFAYLNSIRSKYYMLDKKVVKYEKFTSMGNGFCFPLESLIFKSLCHAAALDMSQKDTASVYGDDIIVPKSVAGAVLHLLDVCGFKTNSSKTFLEGPFRESCGADWYNGKSVRPVTLDYAFDSVERIFVFCNQVRSRQRCLFLQEGIEYLLSLLPRELLLMRPISGPDNTALDVDLDLFMTSPHARWNRNTFSWEWKELHVTPLPDKLAGRHEHSPTVLLRAALRGASSRDPFTLRNATRKCVRRKAAGSLSTWLPGDGPIVRLS